MDSTGEYWIALLREQREKWEDGGNGRAARLALNHPRPCRLRKLEQRKVAL
jgi:hypothetical protein